MVEATLNNSQYRGSSGTERQILQSIVECRRSLKGMKSGGLIINMRRCPRMKSEVHKDISTILTINSRAGWDIAYEPSPRPCQRPVHHARFDSSCCSSRERKTEIRNFMTALWIAIIAMRPNTACEASQSSRNHWKLGYVSQCYKKKIGNLLTKNSKKATVPIKARTWAMAAIVGANLAQQPSNTGPRNSESMKSVIKTVAFQTMGPMPMIAMRTRGLGGVLPFTGKDFTNMYATMKRHAVMHGRRISEKITVFHRARGVSPPEPFSVGWPSFFFL